MKTNWLFPILLFTCIGPFLYAQDEAASPTPDAQTSDSFFGMTKVWEIHIQFDPRQWNLIQPPADANFDFRAAMQGVMRDALSGGNFHSEQSSRPGLAGYMGVDHQYGMATLTIGDDTITEVGVRYKGNGTFMQGQRSGKFSYKIDFNEYREQQEYRGLTKVNLNGCVADPSMLREALSYELFREAGIPSPRIAWAKVYLTVVGQQDRVYQGLYEVLEQVDKRFLKSRFGSADGLLVKPSTFGTFRYLGGDWEDYRRGYYPKTEGTWEQQQRLIAFAKLIYRSSQSAFAAEIEDYLEMDQFLNFLAVNVILSNLDSFLGGSQNYYAYVEPKSNKIQVWPWDLDHSFGTLGLIGNPDSRRNLSIYHPGIEDHRLIRRVLAMPKYRDVYLSRIRELIDGAFEEERMRARIDEAGQFLRPLVALEGEEALNEFDILLGEQPTLRHPHVLKYFVTERHKSIQKQLAGESEGERLSFNMPPEMRRLLLGIAIAALFAMLLNAGAWLWGVIAGFKNSFKWGLLNLFLYPITPIAYGFVVRKDIGRRAAIATCCACLFSVAMVTVSAMLLS